MIVIFMLPLLLDQGLRTGNGFRSVVATRPNSIVKLASQLSKNITIAPPIGVTNTIFLIKQQHSGHPNVFWANRKPIGAECLSTKIGPFLYYCQNTTRTCKKRIKLVKLSLQLLQDLHCDK
ncbi:MAG: hypothetical protein K0R08_159 [Solimicrobium sp.]|jgi:hypothetical protein|nr:hypothetical protein [Solimicrobium sp.]